MQTGLSLQFGACFADLIFQKCHALAGRSEFLTKSSRYSLVHFLAEIEARTRGNRDPPGTPKATLYPKKQRVWRPKAFSPVNSRLLEVVLSPTAPTREPMTRWWHDDDMMMAWLWYDDDMVMTWWWHDDKAAPVKFVRNPEVFELNFLWLEHIVLHGYSLCICTWFWIIWIRNCAL